jgi:hypothetical protein
VHDKLDDLYAAVDDVTEAFKLDRSNVQYKQHMGELAQKMAYHVAQKYAHNPLDIALTQKPALTQHSPRPFPSLPLPRCTAAVFDHAPSESCVFAECVRVSACGFSGTRGNEKPLSPEFAEMAKGILSGQVGQDMMARQAEKVLPGK